MHTAVRAIYYIAPAIFYAKYFHGELVLNEDYGTDAIVYFRTKEVEAMELLPVYSDFACFYSVFSHDYDARTPRALQGTHHCLNMYHDLNPSSIFHIDDDNNFHVKTLLMNDGPYS